MISEIISKMTIDNDAHNGDYNDGNQHNDLDFHQITAFPKKNGL